MASRWFFVRFELRQARLRIVDAIRIALFGKPPAQPVPTLCPASPGPGHPSELCHCPCGPDGYPEEHEPGCPWLAKMCDICDGDGCCPVCRGDGCKGKEFPLDEILPAGATPDPDAQLPLPLGGADPCLWAKSRAPKILP